LEYFEENPPKLLNFRQAKEMGWHRTAVATIDELYFQYVQQQVVHSHHLDDILNQSRHARQLVSEAQVAVAIGCGFGAEIDALAALRNGPIWAVEKNTNAWPVLNYRRDWLTTVGDLSDLPVFEGAVVFTAVHVLRQPSLADDDSMRTFAIELLRVAPHGFSMLSTLPNSYQVDSKFAQRKIGTLGGGIDADDLLCESLREIGANATITLGGSNCLPRARLAKIEVVS
jgi:hypothetical protein